MSINPQINRDLNSAKMHFYKWWLMPRTISQTQNLVNLDFEVKFGLEDQVQWPPPPKKKKKKKSQ